MVKQLFSRLIGKTRAAKDDVPTPDLARVLGPNAHKDDETVAATAQSVPDIDTVDVDLWLRADLDRLHTTWDAVRADPDDSSACGAFRQAVHNLFGASGAYGGGSLTRLSGSLHKLVTKNNDFAANAALINLHIQACRAASFGGASADSVADAVCEALETQVDQAIAA